MVHYFLLHLSDLLDLFPPHYLDATSMLAPVGKMLSLLSISEHHQCEVTRTEREISMLDAKYHCFCHLMGKEKG